MKKIILTVLVLFTVTLSSNAQFKPGTTSLQPKIGIGAANLTGMEDLPVTTYTNLDKMLGAAALMGLELEYQIQEKIGIAFGLNYALQGCAWENYRMNDVKYKNPRIETEYVNIPIVFNYYYNKGWALKAGIQLGFLTNAHFKIRSEEKYMEKDATTDLSLDLKDEFESFDVSIPFGISYESDKHWVFDARYHLGLTKVNKNGSTDSKNGVFMITAGYKFEL